MPRTQAGFRSASSVVFFGGQDGLTGSAWGDWSNYTDSPLRAFENELGVQVCGMNFTLVGENLGPENDGK